MTQRSSIPDLDEQKQIFDYALRNVVERGIPPKQGRFARTVFDALEDLFDSYPDVDPALVSAVHTAWATYAENYQRA